MPDEIPQNPPLSYDTVSPFTEWAAGMREKGRIGPGDDLDKLKMAYDAGYRYHKSLVFRQMYSKKGIVTRDMPDRDAYKTRGVDLPPLIPQERALRGYPYPPDVYYHYSKPHSDPPSVHHEHEYVHPAPTYMQQGTVTGRIPAGPRFSYTETDAVTGRQYDIHPDPGHEQPPAIILAEVPSVQTARTELQRLKDGLRDAVARRDFTGPPADAEPTFMPYHQYEPGHE